MMSGPEGTAPKDPQREKRCLIPQYTDHYQRVQITSARSEAPAGMPPHEFDQLMATEPTNSPGSPPTATGRSTSRTGSCRAHYADAIPLAVLKREQDRVLGELDQVNRRLDAHHGEYTDARAHLDDALNPLGNCADIHARCDDANRRLCNEAFFTEFCVDEDDELPVENNRPFEMLPDPEANANALTWAADADKTRTPAIDSVGQGSSLVCWVPPTGFEPVLPP